MMNIIQKIFNQKSIGQIAQAPLTVLPFMNGESSATGVSVTARSALQHEAVYYCVRTLTADIAKIPLHVEVFKDGGWEVDHTHPLGQLIRSPNQRMITFELLEHMVFSQLCSGNSYIVVIRDNFGTPRKLIPIHPGNVQIFEDPDDGELFYKCYSSLFGKLRTTLASEQGLERTISQDDMIHTKNISLVYGYKGQSVFELVSEAFGLAIATQEAAASAFRNGAHINGFFGVDGTLPKEQIMKMHNEYARSFETVVNSGKTPFLPGVTWNNIDNNIGNLQLVEARRQETEDIGRIFRMPNFKLGLADSEKAANISEQEQSYINNTLVQYTRPFEQHLDRVLIADSEKQTTRFRFDFSKEAEPSALIRAQTAASALYAGWQTVNEVRRSEGLRPMDGGDVLYKPENMGITGDTRGVHINQGNNDNED